MADPLVIDASAAIALLRDEGDSDVVRSALHDPVLAGGEIAAPDHFWIEVANVLVRRYRYEPADVVEAIRELDELAIRSVGLDRPLVLLALTAMTTHGLSAYDATYLALAEVLGGKLLTLDQRLAAAAGDRAVLGRRRRPARSSETKAVYGARTAAGFAAFGLYFAELRRRAEAIS